MRRWASVLIRGVVQETPAPRRPACPARESGPAVRDKRTKAAPGDEPRVLPPSVCPVCPHETSYMIRRSPRSPVSSWPTTVHVTQDAVPATRRPLLMVILPWPPRRSTEKCVGMTVSSVSRYAAIFFISFFFSNKLAPSLDWGCEPVLIVH